MNVVLTFYRGDFDQAIRLFDWIKYLGGCRGHSIIISCSQDTPDAMVSQVIESARESFDKADLCLPRRVSPKGWPDGPNFFFRFLSEVVFNCGYGPFLWLEPDCIPMRSKWMDEIEGEYACSGTPFMGSINQDRKTGFRHLSGVAVYPGDAYLYWKDYLPSEKAFDMIAGDLVLPKSTHNRVIYNYWGQKGLPPIFKEVRTKSDPVNTMVPSQIPPETALFHRNKTGSLIEILKSRSQKVSK